MKRVLLFFMMILLVLVSARSVFCEESKSVFSEENDIFFGIETESESLYGKETKKLKNATRAAKMEYNKLKMEADSLVSKDIDESSLQSALRLIELEMNIVNSLLKNKTGVEVDELLIKRDKLFRLSTRTVAFIYKTIMNFATSDIIFNAKRGCVGGSSPLRGHEKKLYLKSMKNILTDYHKEFSDKQYFLSQQTLCLPTDRYNLYVAQNEEHKKDLQTNIEVADEMPYISDKNQRRQDRRVVDFKERYIDRNDHKNDRGCGDRYDGSRREEIYEGRKSNGCYLDHQRDDYDSRTSSRCSDYRYDQRKVVDRRNDVRRGSFEFIRQPSKRFFSQKESFFEQKADLFSFQSDLRNEIDDNIRNFGSNFMSMRNSFIEKMRAHEVVSMIDNVVFLIKDEIQSHVGSKKQRNKMFHGEKDQEDLNPHIDVVSNNSHLSKKSKILFGAVTDAATKKTMELGSWNPDIYELNLRHYLSRFEYFKSDMERMINHFKDDLKEKFFSDCKRFQASLDNLMNNLVYSVSSAK